VIVFVVVAVVVLIMMVVMVLSPLFVTVIVGVVSPGPAPRNSEPDREQQPHFGETYDSGTHGTPRRSNLARLGKGEVVALR